MIEGKVAVLPKRVPTIRLRYGQAIWLLTELGLRGLVNKSTFHEYIKALRKIGIPFEREKLQPNYRRKLAHYSYCDLMELAVTLSLRVYHVVPDSVIKGIIHNRDLLHQLFRRAYDQRLSGYGEPFVIRLKARKPLVLRGLFLDLNIKFAVGHLVHFGPPKLLSSVEALTRFGRSLEPARPLAPINLSFLSEQVVALALNAPANRSELESRARDDVGRRHRLRPRLRRDGGTILGKRSARQARIKVR